MLRNIAQYNAMLRNVAQYYTQYCAIYRNITQCCAIMRNLFNLGFTAVDIKNFARNCIKTIVITFIYKLIYHII